MTSKEIEDKLEKILTIEQSVVYNPEFPYTKKIVLRTKERVIKKVISEVLALIQQARVDQTKVIRDRFVRSGWEYKWLTEVISEMKGETK